MLRIDSCETPEQIETLNQLINQHLKINLPIEHLQGGYLISLNRKLVSSFIIMNSENGRLLNQIPDSEAKRLLLQRTDYGKNAFEINGLWISSRLSGLVNLWIWCCILLRALSRNERHLIISRSAKNRSIQQYHDLLDPTLIFEGEPVSLSSSTSYKNVKFFECKKVKLLLLPFVAYRLIFRRINLGFRQFLKH